MADGSASIARNRLASAIAQDHVERARAQPVPGAAMEPTEVQGTRWRGASKSLRSMANWAAGIGSATSDQPSHEQRTMRARSRDAMRNHMVGRSALMRSRTSIVGTGLVCRPAIDHEALRIDADAATEYNRQLRAYFESWAEDPNECDIEATLDFYGQQSLSLLSAMASGDCMALTPWERRPGGIHGLKLQLIEADRVCNKHEAPDSATCIDGVQLRGSTPEGYWVRSKHPGDAIDMGMPSWTFYPAFGGDTGRRRVLHVWNDKERPEQVRGVPFLAPILEPLKQIERYSGAELSAAVLSAMLTVFIERAESSGGGGEGGEDEAFDTDEKGHVALGQGAIVDLAEGESANVVNPGRPNVNFDPFFNAVVKQIGAALEIPLDVLLLQFNTSYSAARAAMLEAWRMFLTRRWWLVQQFCQPVYGLLIDEGVASGRLKLPGYGDAERRRAWTRAIWTGPAKGAMDEYKEALAAEKRIAIGVSNEQMEAAGMTGEDRDAVYAQRKREIDQRRKDNTWFPPRDTTDAGAKPVNADPEPKTDPKTDPVTTPPADDDAPATPSKDNDA
jgi:lambda family phage portal protein